MNFERVRKIADAVLYEGYLLYPYRPSSTKNQYRWQFGVVAPPGYGGDPSLMRTECLVEPGDSPVLDVAVRYLQVHEDDSAVEREVAVSALPLSGMHEQEFENGVIRVQAGPAGAYIKLRVDIENRSPWTGDSRDAAMCHSLVGAHTLLGLSSGAFVSLIDPPQEAKEAAASCSSLHTFPVLAGAPGERDMMLSSPIILYDYPAVAPESPGDFCDATEIDELLTLRVMTLTDEEKREACAADERARAIIERSDAIPPEIFERLHGAIRHMAPRWAAGDRVRLHPRRRSDSMDLFLAGRLARVREVHRDLENRTYIAVVVEDDPAADLHESYGRFFYFDPDELELVTEKEP